MSYYNPEKILIDIEIPHYIFLKQVEDDVVNNYLSEIFLDIKYKEQNNILSALFDLVSDLNAIDSFYNLHWQELQLTGIENDILKIDYQLANIIEPKVIYHSFVNSIISILKYYNTYLNNRLNYVFETIVNSNGNRYTTLLTRRDIFMYNLQQEMRFYA